MCKAPKPPKPKEPEKLEFLRNPFLDGSSLVQSLRAGRDSLRVPLSSTLPSITAPIQNPVAFAPPPGIQIGPVGGLPGSAQGSTGVRPTTFNSR